MKYERSKYSGDQILGFVFDDEKQALNTHLDAEFAIELNHEDGDSVLSVLPTLELSGNQEKSCNYIKNIVLYVVKGSVKLQVSPLDEGDLFFDLINPIDPGMYKENICAKRIRLVLLSEDAEAHLCGQG